MKSNAALPMSYFIGRRFFVCLLFSISLFWPENPKYGKVAFTKDLRLNLLNLEKAWLLRNPYYSPCLRISRFENEIHSKHHAKVSDCLKTIRALE